MPVAKAVDETKLGPVNAEYHCKLVPVATKSAIVPVQKTCELTVGATVEFTVKATGLELNGPLISVNTALNL